MNRRVNELMRAVHFACDQGDCEVARSVLVVVESMLPKLADGQRRRVREAIIASHERLWHLQQEAAEKLRLPAIAA